MRLLAMFLAAMVATGCVTTQPAHPPVNTASPDFVAGYEDGSRAGERTFVGDDAACGFVAGFGIVVLIAVLVAAAGGGGSGGNCGSPGGCGGGGGGGGGDDDVPPEVANGSPDYVAGWRQGYRATAEVREESAMFTGFVIGVVIFGGVAAWYLSDKERREEVFDSSETAIGVGVRF